MSDESSDGSEFEVRKEGDDDDSESDGDRPSWMLGSTVAPSTTAPTAATSSTAPVAKKPNRTDEVLDNMLGSFLGEVNGLKTAKKKKMEQKFASPGELVERLMSKETMSAFEVLMIAPDATEGEITKMYRKVSFLVHPDKCKHEQAHDAFQKVAKAYEELKDPTYKEKYIDVIDKAKAAVKASREEENKRRKDGEDPLEMEGPDFDRAVVAECDRMLNVTVEKATYAETVRSKNEARMEALQKERKKRERTEMTDKKKWEVNRDKRVAGWQIFRNNVEQKRFKNMSSGRIGALGAADRFHQREERTELQEEQLKKDKQPDQPGRPAGSDFSFKNTWR